MTIYTMKWFAIAVLASLLGGGHSLQAQTASELLQKGIYLQETMGDLDGAMKIYKQVGQMAQQSRADAAQAQYRLGLCLEKKGQQAEAARTFQKLVELYPEQTDLVAKVKAALPSGLKLLPAPWVDGEILDFTYTMGNMSAEATTNWRFSVRSSKTHPGNWILEQRLYNSMMMAPMEVEVEGDTMRPLMSRMAISMFPDTLTTYRGTEASVDVKGKDLKIVKFDGAVFDLWEIPELLRRLPLTAGYKTSLQVLNNPGGAVSNLRISVAGEENVKTPAGEFHAYRVESESGLTYWISTASPHYPVKFEQGGTSMTGLLSAIRQAAESTAYRNDKLGFSLNLPAGWTAIEFTMNSKLILQLVDSESLAVVTLAVEAVKSDPAPTAAAMRANAGRKAAGPNYPVQTVRPDSWQTRQIGGHPAVSWVVDSAGMPPLSKDPNVVYTVWVRSAASHAELSLRIDPKELDTVRPRLDAILDTLTLR
jgi:tetratricopeptide (TPR) repeat protein